MRGELGSAAYLGKVILRSHASDFTSGTLEDYVGDSVTKGWLSIWWAYREAHKRNLSKVSEVLGNEPLPELPK